MQSNKSSGTKPELTMARALRKRVIESKLPGRPDFVYPKARVAVFVHGCWWHRCPICDLAQPRTHAEYWKRKLARNVERDKLNKLELESMGWKVVEIWEHEVKKNAASAARGIRDFVANAAFT